MKLRQLHSLSLFSLTHQRTLPAVAAAALQLHIDALNPAACTRLDVFSGESKIELKIRITFSYSPL